MASAASPGVPACGCAEDRVLVAINLDDLESVLPDAKLERQQPNLGPHVPAKKLDRSSQPLVDPIHGDDQLKTAGFEVLGDGVTKRLPARFVIDQLSEFRAPLCDSLLELLVRELPEPARVSEHLTDHPAANLRVFLQLALDDRDLARGVPAGTLRGTGRGDRLLNPILESFVQQPSNPDVLQALAQHIGGLLTWHATLLADVETNGDKAYDQAYWRARRPQSILGRIVRNGVPAFLVGGWFDLFQRGEPLNYSDLQNLSAGRGVGLPMKAGQQPSGRYQLLMGPWYHVTAGEGIDMNRLELAWFDRWLKGQATGIEQTKTPLHLYQLGSGKWLDAARYPFEGATPQTYYLGAGKSLRPTKPGAGGGSDQIVWTGLSSPCGLSTEQWGAGVLQLLLESAGGEDPCAGDDSTTQVGPGAVSYTTAPFGSAQVLAGPIDATLYAKSNRPDTEFVVTIEDVAPDGSSKPLTTGSFLGSFRKLDRARTWFTPDGKPLLPYHAYTRRLTGAGADRRGDPLRHRGASDVRQARRRPQAAGHDHHLGRPTHRALSAPDREPGRRRLRRPAQLRGAPRSSSCPGAGRHLHQGLRDLPLSRGPPGHREATRSTGRRTSPPRAHPCPSAV